MIPINPLVAEPGVHRADFIGRGIYMAGAFGMLGVLLVFFVSALLAGGQFGPTSDVKWDVLVPWPAVPVPGWFVIALCLLPVVGAVILVLKATWAQAPELVSLLGMTVIMFILLPVAWARMYPETGGAGFSDRYPELGLGQHWLGALPQLVTLLVLGIRLAMLVPRYNAERRRSLQAADGANLS